MHTLIYNFLGKTAPAATVRHTCVLCDLDTADQLRTILEAHRYPDPRSTARETARHPEQSG